MRVIDQLNLHSVGFVLIFPRLMQIIILIFGILTMSCAFWQGKCVSSFQPKHIVNIFEKLSIFSFVYCILTQISIYNIFTELENPFYDISISWGIGFMYDIASEIILWINWLWMKKLFYFPIAKCKKTID